MSEEVENKEALDFSGVSERVKNLIGDMPLRRFAKKVGVSEATLRGLFAGKRPYLDTIAAIARGAGVDFNWLATGEGSPEGPLAEGAEEVVYVPLYDVEAAAGAGAWNEDEKVETMVPFSARFLREIGANLRHLHLIRAKGGSMEPLILDGDWLLVDISQTDPRVSGVYVIRRGGHLLVKHVQPRPKAAAFFVYSENPREKTGELVREDDLDVIGRVLWIMRRAG